MRYFFFFKQKTAYEMRISDWSSDVCSSDLAGIALLFAIPAGFAGFQAAHALGSLATDNSMLLAILGSIAAMATSLSAWRSVTMSERDTHVTSKFASPVGGQASTGQSMSAE